MDVTINLYALGAFGLFILFCLIAVVCIYLIIGLRSAIVILKRFDKLVEVNNENINKTLTLLPDVTKNVNDAAAGVKDNLDKVGSVIGTVDGALTETVATMSEGTENILNIVKIASGIISAVINVFSSDKK